MLITSLRQIRFERWLLLAFIAFFALSVDCGSLYAASGGISPSDITGNVSNDAGVVDGLTKFLNYAYLFMKVMAIIAVCWGCYKMWEGEIGPGVWAFVAAFGLFFAPKIVQAIQNALQ